MNVTKFFVLEHCESLEDMADVYQTFEAGCDSVAEAVRNVLDFNSDRGRVIGLSYAEFIYFKLRSEICFKSRNNRDFGVRQRRRAA